LNINLHRVQQEVSLRYLGFHCHCCASVSATTVWNAMSECKVLNELFYQTITPVFHAGRQPTYIAYYTVVRNRVLLFCAFISLVTA